VVEHCRCNRLADVLLDGEELTTYEHPDFPPVCPGTMRHSCAEWVRDTSLGTGCSLLLPNARATVAIEPEALAKGTPPWPLPLIGTDLGVGLVVRQLVAEDTLVRPESSDRYPESWRELLDAEHGLREAVEEELSREPGLKLDEVHSRLEARGVRLSFDATSLAYEAVLLRQGALWVTSWLIVRTSADFRQPPEVLSRIDACSSAGSRERWDRALAVVSAHERWLRERFQIVPKLNLHRMSPGGRTARQDELGTAIAHYEASGYSPDQILLRLVEDEKRRQREAGKALAHREVAGFRDKVRQRLSRRAKKNRT
jgi:hypothetical protein